MADEDFEIDIYGDTANEHDNETQAPTGDHQDESHAYNDDTAPPAQDTNGDQHYEEEGASREQDSRSNDAPQQGVKRKSESEIDDRPVDPNATPALMLSDLNWWTTDDGVRAYTREVGCEDELKEVTFSEHRVNGRSKG